MKREFALPAVVASPTTGSVVDQLLERERIAPSHICISVPDAGGWRGISTLDFTNEVRAVAKGIIASGVQPGDRVGVMSRTRYEWTLVDYAIWYAGASSVPIYETSSAEQVEWILSDSGAVAAFLESPKNRALVDEVRPNLAGLAHIWVFDNGDLETLKAAGAHISNDELQSRKASVTPDSLATIIYTSGTTGRPKGCMLTHRNCMFEIDNVVFGLPDVFLSEDASTILFLPIAHVFGRVIQLGCIRAGARLAHAPDIKDLLPSLQSFKPTFLLAVPRVFEKVYNSAQQKANADGKGHIFETAAETAVAYSRALDTGGRQVAHGHGWQSRMGSLRRCTARRSTRTFLPRHRGHHP